MPDPAPEDRLSKDGVLRTLVRLYELDARENIHIMNRCAFMLTAIVVVGGLAVKLCNASWLRDLWPQPLIVAYGGLVVLIFASLAIAISFLIAAVLPRYWTWPCEDAKTLCEHVTNGRMDEAYTAVVTDLSIALTENPKRNSPRYRALQRSLYFLIGSVVLAGLLAIVHGLIVLSVLPTPGATS